jgi:progressive ankylosis protein
LLTFPRIFKFWLPLALSWWLMTVAGPWVQGVISRQPDAETQLAAFGIVMSLSITIEAPVIMMLATSTALAVDRGSLQQLWRYMMAVNVLVTIIALLFAFTPLFDLWVGGVLGIPNSVKEAARPGMVIMILWSGLIGYRRFYQGLLIRTNHTRAVGFGTLLRVIASAGTAVLLGVLGGLPGVAIGASAMMVAVIVEAIYARWVVRDSIAEIEAAPPTERSLTYRMILNFHLPLAMTSVLALLVRPMLESGLASTDRAEQALAAWAVVWEIMLVMRAGGFAFQEVAIALNNGPADVAILRRFMWSVGLGLSGLMLLIGLTPLMDIYLGTILAAPENIHEFVVAGTLAGASIPLLTTMLSFYRALLMKRDTTAPIYQAMVLNLLLTAALLWAMLNFGVTGIVAAAGSLAAGQAIETGYLWYRTLTPRPTAQPIPASGD